MTNPNSCEFGYDNDRSRFVPRVQFVVAIAAAVGARSGGDRVHASPRCAEPAPQPAANAAAKRRRPLPTRQSVRLTIDFGDGRAASRARSPAGMKG